MDASGHRQGAPDRGLVAWLQEAASESDGPGIFVRGRGNIRRVDDVSHRQRPDLRARVGRFPGVSCGEHVGYDSCSGGGTFRAGSS